MTGISGSKSRCSAGKQGKVSEANLNFSWYFRRFSLISRFVLKNVTGYPEEFDIAFVKLKDGVHEFHYELGKQFFEAFGNQEVLEASVQVDAELEKQGQMMQIDLSMRGSVNVTCDRCLESIGMPVDTRYRLIYKFRDEEKTEPEDGYELVYITPQETEVNIAQPVYETVLLDIPMIRNCDGLENKPCNEAMLQKLNQLKHNGEEQSDPRWDKLKDLLK